MPWGEPIRGAREGWSSFARLLTEEALRPEGHDQDQDGEHDCGRPLGPELEPEIVAGVGDGLDDADDEAADDGALEVADTAHHRRREGDQPGREALVVTDGAVVEHED